MLRTRARERAPPLSPVMSETLGAMMPPPPPIILKPNEFQMPDHAPMHLQVNSNPNLWGEVQNNLRVIITTNQLRIFVDLLLWRLFESPAYFMLPILLKNARSFQKSFRLPLFPSRDPHGVQRGGATACNLFPCHLNLGSGVQRGMCGRRFTSPRSAVMMGIHHRLLVIGPFIFHLFPFLVLPKSGFEFKYPPLLHWFAPLKIKSSLFSLILLTLCALSAYFTPCSLFQHQLGKMSSSGKQPSNTTPSESHDQPQTPNTKGASLEASSSNTLSKPENTENAKSQDQLLIEKKLKKLKIDPKTFISQLVKAKEITQKTMESSLFGFIVGNPIKFTKLRARIRNQWRKLVTVEPEIINRQYFWFELRFKNPEDKQSVWENRPFHMMGQLLVLREWKPDFNASKESKSMVDLWFRLPKLSPLFLTNEALPTILEGNGLGTLIKYETQHNRICANLDIAAVDMDTVIVPDEAGNLSEINIWFDDNQKGCGRCGERDHSFNLCPERPKNPKVNPSNQPKSDQYTHSNVENQTHKMAPKATITNPATNNQNLPTHKTTQTMASPWSAAQKNPPTNEKGASSNQAHTQNIPVIYLVTPMDSKPNKEGDISAETEDISSKHGTESAEQTNSKNKNHGNEEMNKEEKLAANNEEDDYEDDDLLEDEMEGEYEDNPGVYKDGNDEEYGDCVSAGSDNSFKVTTSFEKHLFQRDKEETKMETSDLSRKRRNTNEDDTATSAPTGPKKKRN